VEGPDRERASVTTFAPSIRHHPDVGAQGGWARLAVSVAMVAWIVVQGGCARPPAAIAPPPPPVPEVTVVAFEPRVTPEWIEVTGRIEAVSTVDIRSRITGYLTEVAFRDGQFVHTGERLYEIDARPYEAKLLEAQGNVEKLLGERRFSEVQVDRYTKLVAKGAASQQELDTHKAKLEQNTGALAAARAEVESARLNVEFCTITSPIDGLIGRTQLQVGNLINQDQTSLATIVSVDPVFVYFNLDEPAFIRLGRHLGGGVGRSPASPDTMTVMVGLVDDVERTFPYRCSVDFLNNQVDTQTATITMRGRLANPHDPTPGHSVAPRFRPGMFGRVRVPIDEPQERLFVPEAAIGNIQDHKIIWMVDAASNASAREVVVGQKLGAWVAVTPTDPAKPLDPKGSVVIRGLQRCRDGKPVTAAAARDGQAPPPPPAVPRFEAAGNPAEGPSADPKPESLPSPSGAEP
jgi:RND family efflux transporter MFP subunit